MGNRPKRKRGATVSARSHNLELETLKFILRQAIDRGIVLENAAEKFKRRKQSASIIELPSHAEFRSLVKTLREAPLAVASGATAMMEFLAYSGMRVGTGRTQFALESVHEKAMPGAFAPGLLSFQSV